jgi:hypothetical protein
LNPCAYIATHFTYNIAYYFTFSGCRSSVFFFLSIFPLINSSLSYCPQVTLAKFSPLPISGILALLLRKTHFGRVIASYCTDIPFHSLLPIAQDSKMEGFKPSEI